MTVAQFGQKGFSMSDTECRALDAYVAEHVMGWKCAPLMKLDDPGLFSVRGGNVYTHNCGMSVKYFHPTTDPAAAMQVLEKCLSHPKCGQITIIRTDAGYGLVSGCDEFAETLPLAICLFAKALFEKEKPALKEQA